MSYAGFFGATSNHPGNLGLTQFSQSLSAALLYFPESHWWSEICSLSKVILVLGKARSRRAPNLGYKRATSPGWFHFSPKIFSMRHNAWAGPLLWWSCQSPVAHSCSLLNNLNSFHRGMFKLNENLMQTHCSTRSVILNVMATQYTCSLNCVYHPHWLGQWSHHCSHTCIPVHSPWLPGYIDVTQTIVVVLTMAGLFSYMSGWSMMAQDFIMILRTAHNLIIIYCLFLEFSI